MINRWLARRAYVSRIAEIVERICQALGAGMGRQVLRAKYGRRWRAAILASFDDPKTTDGDTAIILVSQGIGSVIDALSDAERYHALAGIRGEPGNTSLVAMRLLTVMANAENYTLRDSAALKSLVFEIVGALEGYRGEARDKYRVSRLLEDALKPYNIGPK